MSLGEASVPIRATLDRLDQDLSKARGKFTNALGSIHASVAGLGKIAFSATIAGITAIGGAAVASAVGIVKLASAAEPLVGLQAGFAAVTTRIGTSSETMLASLQAASGGLITNRDLMASFNKAASLVGDDFANRLPDAMAMVQRASQATGQDMGFLFDSLVTGVGRVSPMILDNLGIQVSLAEVTQKAAEMFGVSTGELSKQEQQAALTEIVLAKLNETYGDVPPVDQPLARIRTAMANLKDEIGMKLLPVVAPLAEKLLEVAEQVLPILFGVLEDKVLPVLSGVSTALGLFFDHLSGGMGVVESVATLITQLGLAFGLSSTDARALGDTFREVVATIQEVAGQIWTVIEPVAAAIGSFVSWQDVIVGLGAAIAVFLATALSPIISFMLPIIAAFAAVTAAVALLRTAWENNWGGIQEKVQAVIAFIVPLVQGAIAGIKAWWAANGEAILAKAAAVWEAIKAAISAALEAASAVVQGVLDRIRAFWDAHGAAIMVIVQAALSFIQGIVQSVTGFIEGIWEAHGDAILAGASAAWDSIVQTIDSLIHQAGEIIEAVADAIQGNWEGFHDHINNATEGAWNAVRDFIDTAINTVKGIVETVSEGISGAWDTAMGAIQTATQPAIDLINGIKDAAVGFWNWLKGKVFNFEINLPSLPSWAIPGSPLPIHTAWKSFAQELNRMTVRPRFDLDALTPALALAGAGMEDGRPAEVTNIYNLTAQYAYQDEGSLVQEIRTLEMLRR